MHNSLQIRQALPQDEPELKTIIDASFPRFFRFFALHSIKSQQGATLLGIDEGSVVGFAKLIWFTIKNQQYGCILWLAVHPNQHRKGYATTLVNAGTTYLQTHGSKAVFASATRNNKASLATFYKVGYSKIDFLGLWRRFGFAVFKFYRAIWYAPAEIVLIKVV
jgi:ribosomal protein S18 acetylase RimI-like enzyme